jgi:tetratricopeptide (TPR) repeat protein
MASTRLLSMSFRRGWLALALLGWMTCGLSAQGDFQKGVSYYKQGQYQKAIEEFEQLVKASPDYEAGFRVLGDCYLRLKDYGKAATAFGKATELDGTKFASHQGAATALFNLGRFQEAVTTLNKGEAAARTPRERYQLHQLRGSAWYKLNRFKDAASDLEKAVSIQRGDFNDVFQLGVALLQSGDSGKARQYLEQSVALRPESQEATRFLRRLDARDAGAAIEARQYPRAIQLLTRLVQVDPADADAWYNLGLAQLFSDQLEASEASFRRSAELLPSRWETHDRLGYVYEMRHQYTQALQSYNRALQLHPDSVVQASVKRIEERIRRQQNS